MTPMDGVNENQPEVTVNKDISIYNKFGLLEKLPETVIAMQSPRQSTPKHQQKLPTQPKSVKVAKPPPIVLDHVIQDIITFNKECQSVITTPMSFRTLRGHTWVYTDNLTDHKALKTYLFSSGLQGYSFTPTEEKTQKVVLKGSPYFSDKMIRDALAEHQIAATSISNLRTKSGSNSSSFLLHLPASTNCQNLLKIKSIEHVMVRWEPYAQRLSRNQCFRCQSFGHGSSNCHLAPRCVKCLDSHLTKDCPRKTRDEMVKCCNCGGSHAANYKDCPTYKTYTERVSTKTQRFNIHTNPNNTTPTLNNTYFPALPPTQNYWHSAPHTRPSAPTPTTPPLTQTPPTPSNNINLDDFGSLMNEVAELNQIFNLDRMFAMIRDLKSSLSGVTDPFSQLRILHQIAVKYNP